MTIPDPLRRAIAAIESTPPAYFDPGLSERLRAMSRPEVEDWLVRVLAHQAEVQRWLSTHDCAAQETPLARRFLAMIAAATTLVRIGARSGEQAGIDHIGAACREVDERADAPWARPARALAGGSLSIEDLRAFRELEIY